MTAYFSEQYQMQLTNAVTQFQLRLCISATFELEGVLQKKEEVPILEEEGE